MGGTLVQPRLQPRRQVNELLVLQLRAAARMSPALSLLVVAGLFVVVAGPRSQRCTSPRHASCAATWRPTQGRSSTTGTGGPRSFRPTQGAQSSTGVESRR